MDENEVIKLPDFVVLQERRETNRDGLKIKVYPDFQSYILKGPFNSHPVKDITFHKQELDKIWIGGKWTENKNALISLVDYSGITKVKELRKEHPDATIWYEGMNMAGSGRMKAFNNYCRDYGVETNTIVFDAQILFNNHTIVREDYATKQLDYSPKAMDTPYFDELINTLYDDSEVEKLLWFIGCILTNSMSRSEKMLYLYGGKGTGKGTVIKIMNILFGDYVGAISLQRLTSASEFATDSVGDEPILIDSDTDMSRIHNDTMLLKLTSHEEIIINKKNKHPYPYAFQGSVIAASNQEPDIRNSSAGLTRRLLVVRPTENLIDGNRYTHIMNNIRNERAGIAAKAIEVFNTLGIYRYSKDVDVSMMESHDMIFRFVRENYMLLKDGITLKEALKLYKQMVEEFGWDASRSRLTLERGLQRFFRQYLKRGVLKGEEAYDIFLGIKYDEVFPEKANQEYLDRLDSGAGEDIGIELGKNSSAFDKMAGGYPAQYTNEDSNPLYKWDNVKTSLSELDTTKLHFVRVPANHIVVDFDIKDPTTGEKDLRANCIAAASYPDTYAEVSKSGGGIHLHYIYDGDPSELASRIDRDIEVKVYSGRAALRRQLSLCNDKEIAHISAGILPLKKEEDKDVFAEIEHIKWTEDKLNNFIDKCLLKEHHGATAPEINFIKKVLDDAVEAGVQFDLRNRKDEILSFAMNSSNQSTKCMAVVADMVFSTIPTEEEAIRPETNRVIPDEKLWQYDIEVFSNLFLICARKHQPREFYKDPQTGAIKYKPNPKVDFPDWFWDKIDVDDSPEGWHFSEILTDEEADWYEENKDDFRLLFNPEPVLIRELVLKPLVGYNNRKYDNHIVYNAMTSYTNLELYNQSQKIINNDQSATIMGAYSMSYADVYEFLDIKQSLKKWEIELGIAHDEFEFPWDKPLEKSNWVRCAQYCMHDVDATDIVFSSPVGQDAYDARKLLAELTESSINTKTQTLAERFLFADDPEPQKKFGWYDLSEEFPGYRFDKFAKPKSLYLGEDPSEGGYVYSEPGVYEHVVILDVESLHPHSLIAMRYFGEYTDKFEQLVNCRMHVKHGELDLARSAFDKVDPELSSKLAPYLQDGANTSGLAHALKIIINIVYGMTSAPYDNKFKDPRNIDNCIAKRGALFMLQLKHEVQDMGYKVIHIKTDSIKIANADDYIIEYCMKRAKDYKYTFAHEHTYSKLALLNKAVLYGLIEWSPKESEIGEWETIGAQVREPYVKHTLFSKEHRALESDFFLLKSAKTAIYLGDTFIGKNANVYASNSGKPLSRIDNIDIAKSVQARYIKPIEKYLLKREQEGLTPLEMEHARDEKIARELDIPVEMVQSIINNGFKEEIIERHANVTGTKGFEWRLASDYQGIEDVDMLYYNQLVQKVVDDTYKVGDGDLIFAGTKWQKQTM